MSLRARIALILSATTIIFSIGSTAFAQSAGGGGSGLSITPTRYDLQVDPGKSSSLKIKLRNISGVDINAKAIVNDFESNGNSGEPRIITDTTKQSPQSLRNFLVGLSDVQLAKDQSKEIDLQVQVPQNAAPGAYYSIIRYAAVRQSDTNGNSRVSLTASVGVVVLLTVPGNITQQVKLLGINAYKQQSDANASSFFISQPRAIGINLQNLGNGFSTPFGRVGVKSMFGKEVYNYEVNSGDPRGVILPNSTRIFKDELKNVSLPGRYTVTANISYGSGGDVIVGTSHFWYMPVWTLIVIAVLLILIIAVSYVVYRKLRRSSKPSRR
ncbi:MAG: hypothetical protein NVSMB46_08010 [Candidatus Saccharimonadales bacterium]